MNGHFLLGCAPATAIMAFGFLVQKFDLFLRIASASLNARPLPERGRIVGDIAGLLLMVLGGAMMVLAAVRFRRTTLDIDAKEVRLGPGTGLDIILATLLFLLGRSCLFICHRR
jgi:putative membrane protein